MSLDRDQARKVLHGRFHQSIGPDERERILDRLEGCVQFVEGVTLTRAEALLAAHALRRIRVDEIRVDAEKYLDLANRLEQEADR